MKILQKEDEALKTVCQEIDFQTEDIPALEVSIIKMQYIALKEGALGIAANQVGILKRFFLFRRGNEFQEMINPKILTSVGRIKIREGCLSFQEPKIFYKVKRKKSIAIEFYTLTGERHEAFLTGLDAVVVQHEIDHLDGITMADRFRQ